MEFLDEFESRPRLLFQSKQLPQSTDSESLNSSSSSSFSSSIHKPTLFVCFSLSILIIYLAFFHFYFEPLKSLLLWLSFSLILGPLAPPSLTAGDIRVGLGPNLKEIPKIDLDSNDKFNRKSTKPVRKPYEDPVRFDGLPDKSTSNNGKSIDLDKNEASSYRSMIEEKCEERDWSGTDEELLRKLMGKHPVGMPGRWEAIAEGFKGKHKVERVIMKAKELGERKTSDQDSFKKFLKDRKPVDKRVLDETGNETDGGIGMVNPNVEEGRKESGWSAGEDLALLNALKAFPKDMPLRWEKISASLPGRTKAACIKRVAELKKDFRSSKTSTDQAS